MLKKKLMILAIFLVSLMAVSAVSAADNATGDVASADETNYEVVSVENNGENELEDSSQSFYWLANEIANAKDELNLTRNYTYDGIYENGITINKSIIINGNGYTINGNNQARAFYINASDVVLNNINFVNCSHHEDNYLASYGGAVYWAGDNGVMSNCSFMNSSVLGKFAYGAVYWEGVNGTLSNCNFENSISDRFGAAVCWDGAEGVLSNCNFINSSSICRSSDSSGGAVYWRGVNGSLSGCNFLNSISLSSAYTNSTYTYSDSYGGSVSWIGDNGVLSNCSFVNSSSSSGYYDCYYSYTSYGGAVYWNGANGVLSDCSFVNSSSKYVNGDGISYGGAVYWRGVNGTLSSCNFVNSNSCATFDSKGGAVFWSGDEGALSGSSFVNCSAENGGAVYWWGANGALSDCSLVNCSADSYGGAVYWSGVNGSVSGCSFANSSAMKGGAVYWSGINGTLISCDFVNSVSLPYLSSGGAVYWYGANGVLSDCGFVNCSSTNVDNRKSYGGAVYWYGAEGNVSESRFINCSAENYGGGIYFNGKNCSLVSPTFVGCSAQEGPDWYSAYPLKKIDTTLTVPNVVTTYGSPCKVVATLKDIYGNVISGVKVKIVVGNLTKTAKTNKNGQIGLDISSLEPGEYKISARSSTTSDIYNSAKATAKVVVNKLPTTLSANDVVAAYNVSSRLYATLTDAEGNPIVGTKVNLVLGTTNKTVRTDANGRISASTKNLDAGNYVAVITFAGDNIYGPSNTTANVLVKTGTVLTAKDIVSTYNVSSRMYVTLKDTNGNIITGAKVNVVLGNINKTVKTDAKGRISVSTLPLAPGNYTAMISYAGNDTYFKSSATANVVVNKIPTTLTAKNVVANQGSSTRYYVALKDADGNPLTGVKVNLVLGNINKAVKTDANGRISASLKNLEAGNYTAVISCAGTEIYAASNTTASVVIR